VPTIGCAGRESRLSAHALAACRAQSCSRHYVTAWLDYTLKGGGYAREAFVGDPPEIVERSGDPEGAWENVALKNLP
jgi:hypothetical protein